MRNTILVAIALLFFALMMSGCSSRTPGWVFTKAIDGCKDNGGVSEISNFLDAYWVTCMNGEYFKAESRGKDR